MSSCWKCQRPFILSHMSTYVIRYPIMVAWYNIKIDLKFSLWEDAKGLSKWPRNNGIIKCSARVSVCTSAIYYIC